MKALLETRTLRERIFLLLFIAVGVLLWSLSYKGRLDAASSAYNTNAALLELQQVLLDNEPDIRARMEAGISNLHPDEILNRTRLVTEIENVARSHQLTPRIPTPTSEEGDVFNFHTATVDVQRATLGALIAFTEDVQARAPHMGINEIVLTADRNNPTLLDARFRISSVELAR
ncbi:MAG: hypothetical protein WD490_10465 [Opitutales bacterium]